MIITELTNTPHFGHFLDRMKTSDPHLIIGIRTYFYSGLIWKRKLFQVLHIFLQHQISPNFIWIKVSFSFKESWQPFLSSSKVLSTQLSLFKGWDLNISSFWTRSSLLANMVRCNDFCSPLISEWLSLTLMGLCIILMGIFLRSHHSLQFLEHVFK